MYIFMLQFNQTALHKAAENGHVSVVQALSTAGADINKCDNVSECRCVLEYMIYI